ncbi:MAG: Transcriptional regulator, LysR family protein, partial [Myxococcaceae bacterium]|nr:Transcriptional regulator, LysR family protein [Myxococcaceae bacterium]
RGGRVRVEAALATNDLGVLRAAALAGRGLAMLPLPLIYDDVQRGALVAVLPERLGGENHIAVVYPEREFVPPAVRAFVDAALAWAKEAPELNRKMPECDERAKKVAAKKTAAKGRRAAAIH